MTHSASNDGKFCRRQFFRLAAIGGAASVMAQEPLASTPTTGVPGLEESTIPDLQRTIGTGAISSRALVRGYLGQIDMVNPRLNAVAEVNHDAMAIA